MNEQDLTLRMLDHNTFVFDQIFGAIVKPKDGKKDISEFYSDHATLASEHPELIIGEEEK